MAKIKPTVGRVVLFRPPSNESNSNFAPTPTCAALVAYVHSDDMVNLAVFDTNGVHFSYYTSVPLVQEEEPKPQNGRYCEWMPYQLGQATKTEQAESVAEATKKGFRS